MWFIKYGIGVVIELFLCVIVFVIGILATITKAIYSILMIALDLIGDHIMHPIANWAVTGCPWMTDEDYRDIGIIRGSTITTDGGNEGDPNFR